MRRAASSILCFLAVIALPGLCSAQTVINVDIQFGGTPRDSPVGQTAAHPDPLGATSVWNNSSVSGSALLQSDGVASGVGYTLSSTNDDEPGVFRQANTAGLQLPLLYDYAFDNSTTGPNGTASRNLTLAITGLDTSLTYDLYIYGGMQFSDNADATTDFVVNGVTQTTTYTGLDGNGGIQTGYFLNENYVLFTGLSGGDITVDATPQDLGGGTFGEPTIAGFALVGTPSNIPEPSSLFLILAGSAVGVLRRRR